jgi:hypothetical protein
VERFVQVSSKEHGEINPQYCRIASNHGNASSPCGQVPVE